jgi:hypothetical protein
MVKTKDESAREAAAAEAVAVEEVPAEVTETEPAKTKAELQDELRDAGLPVSGTKAELVERLESVDADEAAAAETRPPDEPAAALTRGECVVDDGTRHVGRAVNGLVCSAHANRYHADGTPR